MPSTGRACLLFFFHAVLHIPHPGMHDCYIPATGICQHFCSLFSAENRVKTQLRYSNQNFRIIFAHSACKEFFLWYYVVSYLNLTFRSRRQGLSLHSFTCTCSPVLRSHPFHMSLFSDDGHLAQCPDCLKRIAVLPVCDSFSFLPSRI